MTANAARGEAAIVIGGASRVLRPSFAALVAAEGELGSLLGFVERAAKGEARLGEIVALFWHCLVEREAVPRDMLGEAVAEAGLAAATPVLRALIGQVLQGR